MTGWGEELHWAIGPAELPTFKPYPSAPFYPVCRARFSPAGRGRVWVSHEAQVPAVLSDTGCRLALRPLEYPRRHRRTSSEPERGVAHSMSLKHSTSLVGFTRHKTVLPKRLLLAAATANAGEKSAETDQEPSVGAIMVNQSWSPTDISAFPDSNRLLRFVAGQVGEAAAGHSVSANSPSGEAKEIR